MFLHDALQIALKIQERSGPMLKDYVVALEGDAECAALKRRVQEFAVNFPMPGFDPKDMKYKL